MSKVSEIFGKFANDEEREAFMTSQFNVITNLTKQVEQLKTENKHLQDLLKKTPLPVVQNQTAEAEDRESEEVLICKEQLRLLQKASEDRELTMEEARKVEIYSKIIIQAKDKSKKTKSPVDDLSTEELLKLVKNEPGKDQH